MATKPERLSTGATDPTLPDLTERWRVQRKQEVVLRLIRGEPFGSVSR